MPSVPHIYSFSGFTAARQQRRLHPSPWERQHQLHVNKQDHHQDDDPGQKHRWGPQRRAASSRMRRPSAHVSAAAKKKKKNQIKCGGAFRVRSLLPPVRRDDDVLPLAASRVVVVG